MAADPQDAPRHAGQVVRRVLLRRNIAIDAETAQLVADAVQAALQPPRTPRPPRRCLSRINADAFQGLILPNTCPNQRHGLSISHVFAGKRPTERVLPGRYTMAVTRTPEPGCSKTPRD
jgi:hypothetical protein